MFSAPFPFRKAVTKVLPLFLTAKFFANFFSSFFSRTPRPRRSDALRHHAQASRPPVCFAFAVAKVLPFTFPAKLFSIFFCPFFQLFSQSPIYQRVIRTKKSPVIHQECQRFLLSSARKEQRAEGAGRGGRSVQGSSLLGLRALGAKSVPITRVQGRC